MLQQPVWLVAAAEALGLQAVAAEVLDVAAAVVGDIQVDIHHHMHPGGFDREDLVSLEEDLDLEGIAVLVFVVGLLATEFVEEEGIAEVWLRDKEWSCEAVAPAGHTGLEDSRPHFAVVAVAGHPWSTPMHSPEEHRSRYSQTERLHQSEPATRGLKGNKSVRIRWTLERGGMPK